MNFFSIHTVMEMSDEQFSCMELYHERFMYGGQPGMHRKI